MASFSENIFVKKLVDLNNSQQSIQTLSLWLIHHRRHSKIIVDVWIKQLPRGGKKLTLIYLANDVLQNSKKKGPEFNRDFRTVLVDGYKDTVRDADEKTKGSLERMLNIWLERGVFEKEYINKIKKHLVSGGGGGASSSSGKKSSAERSKEPAEKTKYEVAEESKPKKQASGPRDKTSKKKSRLESRADEPERKQPEAAAPKKSADAPPKKKKKIELSLREEIELEMLDNRGETPTAEELIRALSDLEHSASSDAAVRERIAALPTEVSDVSMLEKLTDTAEADALAKTVEEACSLLTSYNARLVAELLERKRVAKMLRNFITYQKDSLVESEKKFQEYSSRLDKVDAVHKELKSHVQSLPDLALLPDVTTGGLAPLPSAGDLFSNDKD